MLTVLVQRSRLIQFYFSTKLSKFRKLGLRWVLKEISTRSLKELGWMLLLPLAVIVHLLGYRRVPILVQHIGHLTSEPDTFIKSRKLGLIPEGKYFIVASAKRTANPHLLKYWNQEIKVFNQPLLCLFLEMMTRRYFAVYKSDHQFNVFGGSQPMYPINQRWGERPPILRLTAEDEIWAQEAFKTLGIPQDKWFACLHVREGGFLPQNEPLHGFRNASIENTRLAIEEVIKRGGVVVRVGDSSMSPFSMPGVIDYVHHALKSDRMDVVLCAKARFFMGNTSGLAFLSMCFGIPVVHANMIPVDTLGFRYCDLSIPKLVWSHRLNRYLHYPELFNSDMGSYIVSQQYQDADLRVDENTSEDILDLVNEMLDRLDGVFVESAEDQQRHAAYMALYRPGHYSYGAGSRVGLVFLRKHQNLL